MKKQPSPPYVFNSISELHRLKSHKVGNRIRFLLGRFLAQCYSSAQRRACRESSRYCFNLFGKCAKNGAKARLEKRRFQPSFAGFETAQKPSVAVAELRVHFHAGAPLS